MAGEFEYIDWIRRQIRPSPRVLVGPGDDCAVIAATHPQQLITTDTLMDGVDFVVGEADPLLIGRKALAVSLSDIAAMAGRPTAAVVSVVLPKNQRGLAEKLFEGMKALADEFDCPIVGGDTNSWDGPLVITTTVIGEPTGKGPVLRSGAKPGDWLFVTGPLGGSLASGRHLRFAPCIRESIELHAMFDVHAMIDISDGLASELRHIAHESHCGVTVYADQVPLNSDCNLSNAMADGEDFELLFAVTAEDGRILLEGLQPLHIGECTASGLVLVDADGRHRDLPSDGWSHDV